LIYYCGQIITLAEGLGVINGGAIVVNGDCIVEVGDYDDIKGKFAEEPEKKIDGLVTPGLINLHHHLYSSLARGWNPGVAPESFYEILKNIWWRLDRALSEDEIYYSALIGLIDSIRCGVTTVVDHHSSQTVIDGSLDLVGNAFQESGGRGSICFEISDRNGAIQSLAGLNENIRALQKWRRGDDGLISPMCGLHGSFTLSDSTLEQIASRTGDLNCGYHFHLLEDDCDRKLSVSQFNSPPLDRFIKYGLVNQSTIAAHGLHLDADEIGRLHDTGATLAHCPRSNLNNAVGVINYEEAFGTGLHIGIGTDGMDGNCLSDALIAVLLCKDRTANPNSGFQEVADSLMNINGFAFEKISGQKVGKIYPGYKADFVVWDYDPPTTLDNSNFGAHVFYGLSQARVNSVWVNGRNVYADHQLTTMDEAAIRARCRELSSKLWKRL